METKRGLAFAKLKRCLPAGIGASIALLSAAAVVAGLSAFSVLAGVATFALLLLPLVYACSQVIGLSLTTTEPFGFSWLFFSFLDYFSPKSMGVYKAILNLLKGLGLFALGFFATYLVYGLVASQVDPAFQADVALLSEYLKSGNAESFYELADSSVPLNRLLAVSLLVGVGVAYSFEAYFLSCYMPNSYIQAIFAKGGSRRMGATFYRYYYARVKRRYHRHLFVDGFGCVFFFPLAYALGAGLAYGFGLSLEASLAIGLASGLGTLALFFPYYAALVDGFASGTQKSMILAEADLRRGFYERAQNVVAKEQLLEIQADIERIEKEAETSHDEY